MLTSCALALMKAPCGVLSRQLFRTVASPGAAGSAAAATISCVHTQLDSKMAPPAVWILPISNQTPV